MKKLFLITALTCGMLVMQSRLSLAQWIQSGSITYLTNTGDKVGIGTISPSYKLDVTNPSNCQLRVQSTASGSANLLLSRATGTLNCLVNYKSGSNDLWFTGCKADDNFKILDATNNTRFLISKSSGYIGIGTITPDAKLHVANGSDVAVTGGGIIQVGGTAGDNLGIDGNEIMARNGVNGLSYLYLNNQGGNVIINGTNGTGNVGIGTSSPNYKLDVCGTIRSKEVRVETGWCDYVFDKGYKLPALSEVENYINANKHLPDVTPGSEIESEGLEVGKVSSQMIRKIEELTLYVIELQKQVDELKKSGK